MAEGGIPIGGKKVVLAHDISDFSTSVGGTIYGTTPGGTKIQYDRDMLMLLRGSPYSQTPPANVPQIPGVTSPPDPNAVEEDYIEDVEEMAAPPQSKNGSPDDEGMFAME